MEMGEFGFGFDGIDDDEGWRGDGYDGDMADGNYEYQYSENYGWDQQDLGF
jgi:hypothetical protein